MTADATDRRARGAAIEAHARSHLIAAGLRPLAANANYRFGELDLVMAEDRVVVFVEVRFRRSSRFGDGAVSVDRRKMRRIALAARAWLARHPGMEQRPCRFDVVSVAGSEQAPVIDWIRDAFRLDDL